MYVSWSLKHMSTHSCSASKHWSLATALLHHLLAVLCLLVFYGLQSTLHQLGGRCGPDELLSVSQSP